MKIVSGRIGSPHVTSQQFRQMLEGIIGQGSYIITSGENLKPELSSNNLLKIRSGMMAHHGCISCVDIGTYDEVTLTNGSQGMKRIDLIVNRYTRNAETEVENCSWKVIQGKPVASNPAVPAYTSGNLQNGDLVDDCPAFEVHYGGINVTEVKSLLSVTDGLSGLSSKLAKTNTKLDNESKNWEHIGTKTDKSRIYIDETKYKEIFCELRLYDQYLQITFPVKYINNISTSIEKSFCTGGYQTPQYPGAWAELKTGKMGGAAHPYVYFNRGFVNGNAITNNYGICIWGR